VGDSYTFRKEVPHPASGVGFFHDKPAPSCDHNRDDSLGDKETRMADTVSGRTPAEWEGLLEEAADRPERLAELLDSLEIEIRQETSFLHEKAEPGNLFTIILDFFGLPEDSDYERLARKIKSELEAERSLKRRYRSWLPGEDVLERLFPFIKNFNGEVREHSGGLQFEGFLKFKGIGRCARSEVYTLYLSERFPGRDPANFHLLFDEAKGELVIKRVYRKELPRIDRPTTAARAVLTEMIRDIVPASSDIRTIVVDHAANVETRQALIVSRRDGAEVSFELDPGGDPAATPLGNLMTKLAVELGLEPGAFRLEILAYGVLKIELAIVTFVHH